MQFDRPEIIDLLKFHIEAGCADVLDNTPVNHFAEAELASPNRSAGNGRARGLCRVQEGAAPLTPPITPAVVTAQSPGCAPK